MISCSAPHRLKTSTQILGFPDLVRTVYTMHSAPRVCKVISLATKGGAQLSQAKLGAVATLVDLLVTTYNYLQLLHKQIASSANKASRRSFRLAVSKGTFCRKPLKHGMPNVLFLNILLVAMPFVTSSVLCS